MVSNVQIGGSGSTCRILTLTKSLTKTPTDDTVYDLFDAGVFNQQDPDGLDRSNEETKSSWSSSEEALAACEGLIFNEPLNGGTKCRYHT